MSDGSLKVKISLEYFFLFLFFYSSLPPLSLRLSGFRFCFVLFFNIEMEQCLYWEYSLCSVQCLS